MVIDEDLNVIASYIQDYQIKDKKILITGATGLIGSLLTKGFLLANQQYDLNNDLFVIVRNKEKANSVFNKYLKSNKFHIIDQDITQPINLKEKINIIYHTAAITESKQMITNPTNVINVMINGTKNVLDYAVKNDISSIVNLSSMEVYGVIDSEQKLKEENLGFLNLSNIRSCYPESKRLSELMCLCYANQFGINVSNVRLTQTFGAGVKYDEPKIFAMIARSIIEGKNIELLTKGDSVRDYCYTTDAINAILLVSMFGEKGQTYNVANEDTNMSIYDMSSLIASHFSKNKTDVVIKDNTQESNKYMAKSVIKLDTAKLRNLGWYPRYNLIDMYDKLINSMKEQQLNVVEKV